MSDFRRGFNPTTVATAYVQPNNSVPQSAPRRAMGQETVINSHKIAIFGTTLFHQYKEQPRNAKTEIPDWLQKLCEFLYDGLSNGSSMYPKKICFEAIKKQKTGKACPSFIIYFLKSWLGQNGKSPDINNARSSSNLHPALLVFNRHLGRTHGSCFSTVFSRTSS